MITSFCMWTCVLLCWRAYTVYTHKHLSIEIKIVVMVILVCSALNNSILKFQVKLLFSSFTKCCVNWRFPSCSLDSLGQLQINTLVMGIKEGSIGTLISFHFLFLNDLFGSLRNYHWNALIWRGTNCFTLRKF